MKVSIRRIGNSLGVILPKAALEQWGVGEGDSLELTERGVHAPRKAGFSQSELDVLKRSIALAVVREYSASQIRAQILANLHRWRARGSWVSAYEEWRQIAVDGDDGALFAAMLGDDEAAVRLRQSMPFVGLLDSSKVQRLYEEAAG